MCGQRCRSTRLISGQQRMTLEMTQDTARPANAAPLKEPFVYEAVRQFVATYALPALPVAHIVQGWQNRASLPPGTNDYAVMSILFDAQHGTTVETFEATNPDKTADGVMTLKSLIELHIQVDFCSEDDAARQRARRLAVVTRSPVGVQFFGDYGMSALYADDVRDLSFIGDAKQFVRRYMTTLHLAITEGVTVEFPYFDTAELDRVEDVGAHHKH